MYCIEEVHVGLMLHSPIEALSQAERHDVLRLERTTLYRFIKWLSKSGKRVILVVCHSKAVLTTFDTRCSRVVGCIAQETGR